MLAFLVAREDRNDSEPNETLLQSAAREEPDSALDEGDMRPDQVKKIAHRLGVTEQDVIDMSRRMARDASLNSPVREESEGEWQDWLVDDTASKENTLVEREEAGNRLAALQDALGVLNARERRIFEARRLGDGPMTLKALSDEFNISQERVRQIAVRAFEKVQSAVKAKVAKTESLPPALPRRWLCLVSYQRH